MLLSTKRLELAHLRVKNGGMLRIFYASCGFINSHRLTSI
jgi:hypothetical protein